MAIKLQNIGAGTTTVVKQNGRLGSKKSKTGCLTCKARKVRCGEEKPHCRRCMNAGRECRGYADVFVSTKVLDHTPEPDQFENILVLSAVGPLSRSPSPEIDPFESRALRYYQLNVAAILGGAVDPDFWTTSVLQLSEAEPPVKQALVAVSSIFELQTQKAHLSFADAQQRSAEIYAKALATTAQRVAEPNAEVVALATCILFLCVHCLEGHKDQAVKLLRSGSGVMQKVLRGLQNPAAFKNNPVTATFLPIFERKLVLLRMFGECLPHLRDATSLLADDIEARFSQLNSLDDARTTLHWLIAETHDLIVTGRQHRYSPDVNEKHLNYCLQRQSLQLSAYASWLVGFEKLCAEHVSILDPRQIAFLRLSYVATIIWLSTCLHQDESIYESYTKDFEALLHEAEKVVEDQPPAFTFEMGLIPPLHLTAIKCRVPWIRRRALELLHLAPVREGLWNREEIIRLAARRVDLETGCEIVGDGILFQNAKICDAQAKYTDEEGTHVIFYSKLDGHGEIWQVWEEVIPLWYCSSPTTSEQPLYTQFTEGCAH